jgi:hypothetical protein
MFYMSALVVHPMRRSGRMMTFTPLAMPMAISITLSVSGLRLGEYRKTQQQSCRCHNERTFSYFVHAMPPLAKRVIAGLWAQSSATLLNRCLTAKASDYNACKPFSNSSGEIGMLYSQEIETRYALHR